MLTINSTGRIIDAQSKEFSTYEAAGWQPDVWDLDEGVGYPVFKKILQTFLVEKQGILISESEAKQQTTYADANWDFENVWKIEDGLGFPDHIRSTSTFPADIQGIQISKLEAISEQTYTDAGWDFDTIWAIQEGVSYPFLKQENEPDTPILIKATLTGTAYVSADLLVIETEYKTIQSHWQGTSKVGLRLYPFIVTEGNTENVSYLKLLNAETLAEVEQIDNVINPLISEQINDRYLFTFDSVIDDKFKLLNNEHVIGVDGDYFNVSVIRPHRDPSVGVGVECEHVSYDLNRKDDGAPEDGYEGSVGSIANQLLSGSKFTLKFTSFSESIKFKPSGDSPRQRLIELAKRVGGELSWHKYEVSILDRRGTDNEVEFNIGENIRSIQSETDYREFVPRRAYEIEVIDLAHLPIYKDLSTVNLGDTIQVNDELLDISASLRVLSYERNPFQKLNPRIQIGHLIRDFINQDPEEKKEEPGEFVVAKIHMNGRGSVSVKVDYDKNDYEYYAMEFGTCPLGPLMIFDFENEDGYVEVRSVVDGILGSVGFSHPIVLVCDPIEENGKYVGVKVMASWEGATTPDVKVSIHAVCKLEGEGNG